MFGVPYWKPGHGLDSCVTCQCREARAGGNVVRDGDAIACHFSAMGIERTWAVNSQIA